MHRLSLSLSQRQNLDFSYSSIPTLCIDNIVSDDSRVFQVAAKGTVRDMEILLTAGKASLRDHNPFGWSLLHV